MQTFTDDELFERYRSQSDPDGLARLVERFEERIYNLALSVLKDAGRAEDATQDVFIRLIRARELPPSGCFKPWLYRVALNQALQLRREDSRRSAREHQAIRPGTGGPSMDEAVSKAESLERLSREIDALDPPLQQALLLRYQHDLTFEEIAEVLEKPKGTVSRHVFEAREELRRRLAAISVVFLSLDQLLHRIPSHPVPPGLHAKLESLARQSGVAAPPTMGSPVGFRMTIVAAALLLPAILLTWQSVRRRPVQDPTERSAQLPAGGDRDLKGVSAVDGSTGSPRTGGSSIFGPAGDAAGKVRVLEVKFRVTVTDGLSDRPFPTESVELSVSRKIVLESDTSSREVPEITSESPGVHLVTLRCSARALFQIMASSREAVKPGLAIGYAIADPGETVDLRLALNLEQVLQTARPEELLLRDMTTAGTYGAIRGRLAGYEGHTSIGIVGEENNPPLTVVDGDSFIVIPVEPGPRELTVADGCCTQKTPVTVRGGEVCEVGTQAHLPKPGRDVAGIVTDAGGGPVSGAAVFLCGKRMRGTSHSTRTDTAGRFLFSRVDAEQDGLTLSVCPEDRIGIQALPVEPGNTTLQIRLPASLRIRVRAVSETGTPLAASAWISESGGSHPPGTHVPTSGSSGSDGVFLLTVNAELYPAGSRVKLGSYCAGYETNRTDWIVLQDGMEVEMTLKKETSK